MVVAKRKVVKTQPVDRTRTFLQLWDEKHGLKGGVDDDAAGLTWLRAQKGSGKIYRQTTTVTFEEIG